MRNFPTALPFKGLRVSKQQSSADEEQLACRYVRVRIGTS
jgi:hypothetical protein